MERPNVSPDFTIEDIHKIREYNYEVTKHMSSAERCAHYDKGADAMMKRIEEIRKSKKPSA